MTDKPDSTDPRESPGTALGQFFSELRQRRVLGTVAIYIPIAWGTIKILSFLVDRYGGPDNLVDATLAFIMAGFPIAMVHAWYFDVGRGCIIRAPASSIIGASKTPLSSCDGRKRTTPGHC